MSNARPPAPPAPPISTDDDADLFDLSRLVSTVAPPTTADEPETVIPDPVPTVREAAAVDSMRAVAPRLPARRTRRWRGLQAAIAFAAGAAMALLVSTPDDGDAILASVHPAAIEPEQVAPTKTLGPRPAAAPVAAESLDAPVRVVPDHEERPEIEASEATTARPLDEDAEPADAPVEDEEAEEAEEAALEEPSPEPEDEASTDAPIEVAEPEPAASASMDQLLDHAVAHLAAPEFPTHGEQSAPEPEPAVEEAPAPVGPGREEVREVMEGVRPALIACAASGHGLTRVQLTVTPSGRAGGVRITGAFAGSPEGSCMARAARTARFAAYEGDEPVTLRYPYRL